MKYTFTNTDGQGKINLLKNEASFEQDYFQHTSGIAWYTIVWNTGKKQTVIIDDVSYDFEADCLLPIMMDQTYVFEHAQHIVAWQFNREFYCVVNHDAEVGCVGFLFYGPSPTMFVKLDKESGHTMQQLLQLFEEEFISEETIKGEMLRMLLVRLIITITRFAKKQYLGNEELNEEKFYLLRHYHLLVELHYREQHQVQFYAGLLNKSPKTIANIFSLYSKKTPLQVIMERVITEAKRLFYYTDKSVKEIADELGFDDVSHFSKFFKKQTSLNPTALKKNVKKRG